MRSLLAAPRSHRVRVILSVLAYSRFPFPSWEGLGVGSDSRFPIPDSRFPRPNAINPGKKNSDTKAWVG
ncbi:MAG: hypothetical protein F6J98_15125 [Moorea sp. SIO4G2]|nr:hypothetical protein [Moorena sp. SIO4G2]